MSMFRVILTSVCLIAYSHLFGGNDPRDPAKEKAIEAQLAEISPALVETFHAGTLAMDTDSLHLADSLYSIVYKQAPSFDPLLRRLGMIWVQLGKTEEGIALNEMAVSINRSAYNLSSLATSLYYSTPDEAPSITTLQEAKALLQEAQKLPDGEDISIQMMLTQIALKTGNLDEFRLATAGLQEKFPNEVVTHYYAAILAANDEDWSKAKKEILKAEQLGLSSEDVQAFLDSGVQQKIRTKQYIWWFIYLVLAWMVGLLLLFITGKFLSNAVINSIDPANGQTEVNSAEKRIKSMYKTLINIGGIYYYISQPFILILTVVVTVGLVYLFLMAGVIPIKIMLLLLFGAVITLYGMVRSLLVKLKYTDPGRALQETEAPGLFALTREVAGTMGTKPIDEIRITPTTDLAVYERGTWKEKMGDKGQRILILGVGILNDFKINEFKAVLAHEYGHFAHRDTAGGDVALRVKSDIHKYIYALYATGQTVWWNLAFQFLRLYNFIFRRISHGATRLQEILADRVAAQTYGPLAFQNGLTYVIKRGIEFSTNANYEIEGARNAKRAFNNLYELSGFSVEEIEAELHNQLNRKTTDDDTHPSPADRFRYVSGIKSADIPIDHSTVKDLFLDWNGITTEMTSEIETQILQSQE
jgi:Zn-dependent protease with chaperone function